VFFEPVLKPAAKRSVHSACLNPQILSGRQSVQLNSILGVKLCYDHQHFDISGHLQRHRDLA
jgi:hypothetical protein